MGGLKIVNDSGRLSARDTDVIRDLRRREDVNIHPLAREFTVSRTQRLNVDPNDPVLRTIILENMDYVLRTAGTPSDKGVYFTTADFVNKNLIYEDYSFRQRFLEIHESGTSALTLGEVLEARKGGCFEMALTTHILLASLGVDSAIVTGSVRTEDGGISHHVWVETKEIHTGRLLVIETTSEGAYITTADEAYNEMKYFGDTPTYVASYNGRTRIVEPAKRIVEKDTALASVERK